MIRTDASNDPSQRDTGRPPVTRSRPERTLHLCNALGQLLTALCDIAQAPGPATLIYLEDESPLGPERTIRLKAAFPDLELITLKDSDAIEAFATLPTVFPAILRRNFAPRLGTGWRPAGWRLAELADRKFQSACLYHSGFFMAKVAASCADRVVLREAGLNNYATYPVSPFKAVLRLLSGLPPFRQRIGEERWIDIIEVARPEGLPTSLRRKACAQSLALLRQGLDDEQITRIATIFSDRVPRPKPGLTAAIILTQPLETIGQGSSLAKQRLYAALADVLREAGYTIYVKNHPREARFSPPGTIAIDHQLPVELWTLTQGTPFTCAVALCSAALAGAHDGFCVRAIQLVSPEDFNPRGWRDWSDNVADRLRAQLAR